MGKSAPNNALTDVDGLMVGHFTDLSAASGVTVIMAPGGAVAGVDVRGSAPGTRETDLLNPVNLVDTVHAVVLAGGSAFGLSAVDGVVRWLAGKGWGFPVDERHVAPVVPAAVLFDLGRGKQYVPPIGPDWGRAACESAQAGPVDMGTVGAGTGAVAGSIKGGLGTAGERLENCLTVGALVAVNSLGSVINPSTGQPWEIGLELESEFGEMGRRVVKLPTASEQAPVGNTAIGAVAVDATLTKAQATKIAQMAQDGLARAIRPAHTMFDGDTIFCLATGKRDLPDTPGFFVAPKAATINELGRAAADCMSRAVIHAVLSAESLGTMTAFRDLEQRND